MALQFLLDTNILSELTKPAPSPAVLQALALHEAHSAISAPTLEALTFGCARLPPGGQQAWLRRWLAGVVARIPVLPFDQPAATWLGEQRAHLALLGRPAPRTDGEIAAVAVINGLTLVTRNGRDFSAFDALKLADWHGGLPAD